MIDDKLIDLQDIRFIELVSLGNNYYINFHDINNSIVTDIKRDNKEHAEKLYRRVCIQYCDYRDASYAPLRYKD